ncbi:MAG: TraB/GumN family protein [Chitinophagales bacterium]|nr:TraB/GumN family protein [Chitinophagales bacterium]
MRNILLLVCLVTAFIYHHPANAQGNSLLWKIYGNGLENSSYLYGTMHLKDSRVFHFADSVMAKFEECEALAMEVVLSDDVQLQLMKGLLMDSGYVLKKLLEVSQYDSIDTYCRKNLGYSISQLDRLKPIYSSVILAQAKLSATSKFTEKEKFLDEYFQHLAIASKKNVFALETVEEQLSVFDLLSYKQQADLLMETVRTAPGDTLDLETLINLYLLNDLENMMKFENDFNLPDSLYNSLFTRRNHHMTDGIDTMIRKQSTFIAVGAGHLGGEEGLVNLLRRRGFNVIPIIPTYNNYLADDWYRFTSKQNNFTVDMPSYPSTEIITTGEQSANIYSCEIVDETSVRLFVRVQQAEAINANNGFQRTGFMVCLKSIFGEHAEIALSNETQSSANFRFTLVDKFRIRGTLYTNGHLYYILYCIHRRDIDKTKIERFINSFKMLS